MIKDKLACEDISPNEEQISTRIINIFTKSLKKKYGNGEWFRRFHKKSHGLLTASICIEKTLQPQWQGGIFEAGKTFEAWVRLSNGSPEKDPDIKKAVRGMAIKILNVEGPCLERDEIGLTQDIIMTNNPILFPGTLHLQLAAMKMLFGTILQKIEGAFRILVTFKFGRLLKFFKGQIQPGSLLNVHYSSATPYLYGLGRAVKWHAIPDKPVSTSLNNDLAPDFLRAQLVMDLSERSYDFSLYIQLQEDPVAQPIEDASIEWRSPLIKIGTITIHKQSFNTPERNTLDNQMYFSPWHCVEAHRPLGGVNRIRRVVYREMSELRHRQNNALKK